MTAKVIDLDTAIYEIGTAYEELDHGEPFFVIPGAGISAPSVPLAQEIVSHCQKKVAELATAEVSSKSINEYSHWFDRAYPQPIDRQRYLRSLIENKPVTDACLRLAHLLSSTRRISLVATPNFDDFIARSLAVFGASYAVCDHPDTVDRIDLNSREPKIVHVHGTYKFYDCRNLSDELESRAKHSTRTVRTMAAFLDRALSFSSPLVIGYAGWDGDVIMSAIQRRLEGASLPYRLYWFCYKRANAEDIARRAPWLAEHQDVRLVAPTVPSAVPSTDPSAPEHPEQLLDARSVLEALNRCLNLEEPEITRDPIRFLARQLRATVKQDGVARAGEGVYSFARVIARIERAAELEEKELAGSMATPSVSSMEEIRSLFRTSQDSEAIQLIEKTYPTLRREDLLEIYRLLQGHFDEPAQYVDPKQTLRTLELMDGIASYVPEVANEPGFSEREMRRLRRKGDALARLDRPSDAIRAYERARCVATLNDDINNIDNRIAFALIAMGDKHKAITTLEHLLRRLGGDRGPLWQQAMFNIGIVLHDLGRHADAIKRLEELVDCCISATDIWTQVFVAESLYRMALMLYEESKIDNAIMNLRKLDNLYGTSDHPQIRAILVESLLLLAKLESHTDVRLAAITLARVDAMLAKDEQLASRYSQSVTVVRNAISSKSQGA